METHRPKRLVVSLFPFLLYLSAGIATGLRAWWVFSWGFLGRPVSGPEVLAMIGAVGFLVSAGVSVVNTRIASRVALAAAVAVWPFFIATLAGQAVLRAENQEMEVVFVRWEPGPSGLAVESYSLEDAFPFARLTVKELEQLRTLGLKGKLVVTQARRAAADGDRVRFNAPPSPGVPQARAVVIMREQLHASPVELPQPDRTSVIYLQNGQDWISVPSDTPTIDRSIRLEVANHTRFHTCYQIEIVAGGGSGGTAFTRPEEPYK